MNDDTLTLVLDGEIPLDLFTRAVEQFNGLIAALSAEMTAEGEPLEWQISHLASGSAIITIRSDAEDIDAVDDVVRAYDEVAQALAANNPLPFSSAVANAAYGLTGLLNGKITALTMATRYNRFLIREAGLHKPEPLPGVRQRPSYGEVRGEVAGIMRLPQVRLTLLDHLFGRKVRCDLDETWHGRVTMFWGQSVIVTGLVYRDELTDRPLRVHPVVSIEVWRPPQGDFRRARGAIPWQPGDEPAEVIIRRLRDEQNES